MYFSTAHKRRRSGSPLRKQGRGSHPPNLGVAADDSRLEETSGQTKLNFVSGEVYHQESKAELPVLTETRPDGSSAELIELLSHDDGEQAATNQLQQDPLWYQAQQSTEAKLAILADIRPECPTEDLLELLVQNDGSIDKAAADLAQQGHSLAQSHRKSMATTQSSLKFENVGASRMPKSPDKVKPLTRKGKTLHLFSPIDIANHTPCSIIHNFLPPAQSNDLLKELLVETSSYSRATFKLFDNVVQSPHTACFYVNSLEERERQKADYLYNGSFLSDVREILPEMGKVSNLVQAAVNKEIAKRIRDHYPNGQKLKYQCPDEWVPNAAFVNCYRGGKESVGYHSDQLSYLGPRPVIGSLSLGVCREFRIRKIIGHDELDSEEVGTANQHPRQSTTSKGPPQRSRADEEGQIAIHLPHNSLLVMHADMQEEWKHSIHPASTVEPHPISGNTRINVTYRWYRNSFQPRFTPRCRCGIATVLKCVQRATRSRGRYMWMCQAGGVPGGKSCGFFEWAQFTDDGEPIWKT